MQTFKLGSMSRVKEAGASMCRHPELYMSRLKSDGLFVTVLVVLE